MHRAAGGRLPPDKLQGRLHPLTRDAPCTARSRLIRVELSGHTSCGGSGGEGMSPQQIGESAERQQVSIDETELATGKPLFQRGLRQLPETRLVDGREAAPYEAGAIRQFGL